MRSRLLVACKLAYQLPFNVCEYSRTTINQSGKQRVIQFLLVQRLFVRKVQRRPRHKLDGQEADLDNTVMILCQYPLSRLVSQNAQTLGGAFNKGPCLIKETENSDDHGQSRGVIPNQETTSDLSRIVSAAG